MTTVNSPWDPGQDGLTVRGVPVTFNHFIEKVLLERQFLCMESRDEAIVDEEEQKLTTWANKELGFARFAGG
ncbi:uncharacterized protein H6S33_009648 [Morchella sextelata]|uniref:uncharacterized protein n=1 Tax=Morchella sextelata TaxID=1174677 RepID=UPI001D045843|nr:uncharacterized protein H6S33_009648 [Morchella sextelata]KAH0613268.1 hypothetical protein H6S33_009648 [Morchella sextelata]